MPSSRLLSSGRGAAAQPAVALLLAGALLLAAPAGCGLKKPYSCGISPAVDDLSVPRTYDDDAATHEGDVTLAAKWQVDEESKALESGEELPAPMTIAEDAPVEAEQRVLETNIDAPPQFEIPIDVPPPLSAPTAVGKAPVTSDSTSGSSSPLVTVSVRGAPLHSVLSLIAEQQSLSIVAPSDLDSPVTITLQPTSLENALDAVMAISGCTWTRVKDVIYVTPISKETSENFLIQGREVRVFDLGYAAASDIEPVITGLLSPVGKVFARQVDSKDKRKAVEQVVIEDLPTYVERIAQYIAQADRPPLQVMVEARILQVKLENDNKHGVNLDALATMAGADITFKTQAFATGVGPAGIITVDGSDFDSLIDCLTSTNDTKTLAAPKLLMINGQEAKIQIGRRLGYFVTTTTQTSTLQDVQFLEVGVVLTVTPHITEDGQIVMKVHPKVSSGDINPTTTLPEEETTEVDTAVMVPDGCGVIIGGLIQETDNQRQSKVSYLGDIWMFGRLFQRNTIERERGEVIVALLPRIVSHGAEPPPEEALDRQRIYSPLLTPTLESAPRPEPQLRDAIKNPYLRPRILSR
jgi:type II secretory pathway component GspD/PulD (secretin)